MGFIGGQISADNNAKAVGATLEQQTRNVLGFVRRTLNEGGMDESHVAKLYIYYSRCELSGGCPFGPDRGDWSYQASASTGGSE